MTSSAHPLPGLATDAELAAGRRVVRCGMCGRPLKGREARSWGLGEDCRHKLGERTAPDPGRFDAAQETLPGV
jgi:hypothetical protein